MERARSLVEIFHGESFSIKIDTVVIVSEREELRVTFSMRERSALSLAFSSRIASAALHGR